jgi:hypothetical protein
MKKILLSIAVIISTATQAQTLMESTSVPAPWNPTYTIYQCDSTGITPGASGAGQTWSFPSISTHTNIAKTYVSSFNSNPSYPNAYTHVSASASDDSYYTSSSNSLKYYGGNLLINAFAVNLVYTSPAIMGQYPMSIGTATTATVGGSLTAAGTTSTFTGNGALNADATGTLTLPGRTYTDILRVVTSQTLNATLSIGPITVTQLTYNYYSAAASLVPVLSIATSTLQSALGAPSTQTFVTIFKDYTTVGINEAQQANTEFSVFPNPSSSFVNFNTSNTEASKVIAYDLTGKMVVTELVEFGKAKMNVHSLTNGLYLFTVIGKNNQVLTTGKFNVSK